HYKLICRGCHRILYILVHRMEGFLLKAHSLRDIIRRLLGSKLRDSKPVCEARIRHRTGDEEHMGTNGCELSGLIISGGAAFWVGIRIAVPSPALNTCPHVQACRTTTAARPAGK